MKQYKVDELRPGDMEILISYLDGHLKKTSLEGTYWLELPHDLLTETQAAHKECAPHVVGLVAENQGVACEFLVRTPKKIHCDCMAMATFLQREWIMKTLDNILEQLLISA